MEDEAVARFVSDAFDNPFEMCGLHKAEKVFADLSLAPPHFPDKFWIWISPSGWQVSIARYTPTLPVLPTAVGCYR